jgi:hypothetical protein
LEKSSSIDLHMEKTSTVKDLIDLWPTRAALADDVTRQMDWLKVTAAQVHKWAQAQSIPARYHQAILLSAAERGLAVTAETIVLAHSIQPSQTERGAA